MSASKRYWAEDIIEPEVEVSSKGEITVPTTAGRGFEVRADLVEKLTVRREEIRALADGLLSAKAFQRNLAHGDCVLTSKK